MLREREETMNKAKFVTFRQNNSGGYLHRNEDVNTYVIIEGYDLWQIQSKAREVFHEYRDYCPCCGQRWNDSWIDEDDMTDKPMIYDKDVYDYKGQSWFDGEDGKAIIYYLDGRKEIVNLTKKGEMYND